VATEDGFPVRLAVEMIEETSTDRRIVPSLTYDVFDFVKGPPMEDAFRMKASSSSPIFFQDTVLRVEDCERVVEDMGFPYIHFLHSYLYA